MCAPSDHTTQIAVLVSCAQLVPNKLFEVLNAFKIWTVGHDPAPYVCEPSAFRTDMR